MNPFAAGVLIIMGLLGLAFAAYAGVDEVRCYRRREWLSGFVGVALIVLGLAVAASCFAALRTMI